MTRTLTLLMGRSRQHRSQIFLSGVKNTFFSDLTTFWPESAIQIEFGFKPKFWPQIMSFSSKNPKKSFLRHYNKFHLHVIARNNKKSVY